MNMINRIAQTNFIMTIWMIISLRYYTEKSPNPIYHTSYVRNHVQSTWKVHFSQITHTYKTLQMIRHWPSNLINTENTAPGKPK